MIFSNAIDFYPTPEKTFCKMMKHVDMKQVQTALDPSAGKGDLTYFLSDFDSMKKAMKTNIPHQKWLEKLKLYESHNISRYYSSAGGKTLKTSNLYAIEIDEDLQATLRGKGYTLIDSDFLQYPGTEHFDLLIANFPFSQGCRHLLKAIDITFCGQISAIINAETIRNPCTLERKDLVNKLNDLGAIIEYSKDEFIDAERKTNVEVAFVYINIDRDINTILFDNIHAGNDAEINFESKNYQELTSYDKIKALCEQYDTTKRVVVEQILAYYSNHQRSEQYLSLVLKSELELAGRYSSDNKSIKEKLVSMTNRFYKELKSEYWHKVMDLDNVAKYISSKEKEIFQSMKKEFTSMEFNERNIHAFIANIAKNFPKMIQDTILRMFDQLTKYALKEKCFWGNDEFKKSIHYYNAWKSNCGYKVNKKTITPFRYSWPERFHNEGLLSYQNTEENKFLRDLDLVCGYFNGSWGADKSYIIQDANQRLKDGKNRGIKTDNFIISIFKKGTIHITWSNENALRLFNLTVGKLKGWLPADYSYKSYDDLDADMKKAVDEFEGKENYEVINPNVMQNILHDSTRMDVTKIDRSLQIEHQDDNTLELCYAS